MKWWRCMVIRFFEVWTQWDIDIKWIYFFLQSLPSTMLYWISFSCPLMKPWTDSISLWSLLVIKTQSSLQFQSQCLFNLHSSSVPLQHRLQQWPWQFECQDKVRKRCFFSISASKPDSSRVSRWTGCGGKWIHDQISLYFLAVIVSPFCCYWLVLLLCYLLLAIKNLGKESMEFLSP